MEELVVKEQQQVERTIRNLMPDEMSVFDQMADIDGRNPGQLC